MEISKSAVAFVGELSSASVWSAFCGVDSISSSLVRHVMISGKIVPSHPNAPFYLFKNISPLGLTSFPKGLGFQQAGMKAPPSGVSKGSHFEVFEY